MPSKLEAMLALRLQHEGMLPHYAAKQAAAIVQSVPIEDAEAAGMDFLFADAMANSVPIMFSPMRPKTSPGKSYGGSPVRSPSRAAARKLTVTIKKHTDHVEVHPDELIWSPERSGRNFSVPPARFLKPANTGLFDDIARTNAVMAQVQDATDRQARLDKDAEFRRELDKHMALRRRHARAEDAEHAAEDAATRAHIRGLVGEAWAEHHARINKAAKTQEDVRAFNLDQKRRAAETRARDLELEARIAKDAADKNAAEDAAKAAKAQARKEEVARSLGDNERELAVKKMAGMRAKADDKLAAEAAMAKAIREEEARAAWKAGRDAEIAAKLNAVGEVLVDAAAQADAQARKAEREAAEIQAKKNAEQLAKEEARRATMRENMRYQQYQLAEKERVRLQDKAQSARERQEAEEAARQQRADDKAKAARNLSESLNLRTSLETQIYARARAAVTPAGEEFEVAINKPWLEERRRMIDEARASGLLQTSPGRKRG